MNAVRQATTAYDRAATTMPPLTQIVLLYDGAIRRTREARAAIEQGRPNELFIATSKASGIVEALAASLDHQHGGVIAANLDRLYADLIFRLQRLNLEPEPGICDQLAARLGTLRDAWAELSVRRRAPDAQTAIA
jgi:flagellar protein FliS